MIGAGKDLGVDATGGMSIGPAGYPQVAELAWPRDGGLSNADGCVLYA
jgi:hypothetical protein